MKITWVAVFALVAGSFGLSGCSGSKGGSNGGGGGDNGSGVSIKGQVAADLKASGKSAVAGQQILALTSADGTTVNINRVCSVPVGRKVDVMVGELIDKGTTCVDVNSDGTFHIPVGDAENDWVYLLIDSTLPRKDQVIGFVGLSDIEATGAQLISWPSNKQTGNVDVGTVASSSAGGVQASATVSDVQQGFSLTVDQLETLAKNNELMRAYKNDFVNDDQSTHIYYSGGPLYSFGVPMSAAIGQWTPEFGPAQYLGYGINLSTNDSDLHQLCKGESVKFAFVPPVAIHEDGEQGRSFSPSQPLTNADQLAPDPDGGNCGGGFWQGGGPDFVFIQMFNGLKDTYKGIWTMRKNDVDIGWFDFEVSSPFIDGDPSKPFSVPMPRIRLTADQNQLLTKIEISWMLYDKTSAKYVEATDPAQLEMIQRLIGGRYQVHMISAGKTEEKISSNSSADDPMQLTFTSFANPWNLANGAVTQVREFLVDYQVGRSGFEFTTKNQ